MSLSSLATAARPYVCSRASLLASSSQRRSIGYLAGKFVNAPPTFWSRSPLPRVARPIEDGQRIEDERTPSRYRTPAVPSKSEKISTPAEFLKRIAKGREEAFDGYAEKISSKGEESEGKDAWTAFWTMRGPALDDLGVPVKHRRYILRCMNDFRQGHSIEGIAVQVKKPKKFRGRGDRVQHGFRVRVAKDFERRYNGTQPIKMPKISRKRRLVPLPASSS